VLLVILGHDLDLEPAGLTPDTAAELLIASARGLESSASARAAYRRYPNALVRVMVAGLSGRRPSGAPPPQALGGGPWRRS